MSMGFQKDDNKITPSLPFRMHFLIPNVSCSLNMMFYLILMSASVCLIPDMHPHASTHCVYALVWSSKHISYLFVHRFNDHDNYSQRCWDADVNSDQWTAKSYATINIVLQLAYMMRHWICALRPAAHVASSCTAFTFLLPQSLTDFHPEFCLKLLAVIAPDCRIENNRRHIVLSVYWESNAKIYVWWEYQQ